MTDPLPGSARLTAAARYLRSVAGGGGPGTLPDTLPPDYAEEVRGAARDLGGALAGLLEECADQARTTETLLSGPARVEPAFVEAVYPPHVRRALAVAAALEERGLTL